MDNNPADGWGVQRSAISNLASALRNSHITSHITSNITITSHITSNITITSHITSHITSLITSHRDCSKCAEEIVILQD
jgi:hypothetical protein